jgi:hypothetical protein
MTEHTTAEKTADLATLAAKVGQMVRSNELKMAGKLLATARGHLHELAQADHRYDVHYERVAVMRNELMEPGRDDFDELHLLHELVNEVKELNKLVHQHASEKLLMSETLLRVVAAIVLVYAQDMAGDAPLEI